MIKNVLENSGLVGFAEIGLIAFVFAFAIVLLWIFLIGKDRAQKWASIPLEDGSQSDSDE